MGEAEDSTNHMITYTALREIKKNLIKLGDIQDDSAIKEEEENELEEI